MIRAGLIEEHEATGPQGQSFKVLTATERGRVVRVRIDAELKATARALAAKATGAPERIYTLSLSLSHETVWPLPGDTARISDLATSDGTSLHPHPAKRNRTRKRRRRGTEPPSCPSWGLIRRVNFADTPPSFRPQYTDFAFSAVLPARHRQRPDPRSMSPNSRVRCPSANKSQTARGASARAAVSSSATSS